MKLLKISFSSKKPFINKSSCYHKLCWENTLVNSIEKGSFTGPNKALANSLLNKFRVNNNGTKLR